MSGTGISRITVHRKFNLGNYESCDFEMEWNAATVYEEIDVTAKDKCMLVINGLVENIHSAFDDYKAKHK